MLHIFRMPYFSTRMIIFKMTPFQNFIQNLMFLLSMEAIECNWSYASWFALIRDSIITNIIEHMVYRICSNNQIFSKISQTYVYSKLKQLCSWGLQWPDPRHFQIVIIFFQLFSKCQKILNVTYFWKFKYIKKPKKFSIVFKMSIFSNIFQIILKLNIENFADRFLRKLFRFLLDQLKIPKYPQVVA